jgi:hypothetical protein
LKGDLDQEIASDGGVFLDNGFDKESALKEGVLCVDTAYTDNSGSKAQAGFFPSVGRCAALGEDVFGGGRPGEEIDNGHAGESAFFADLGGFDDLAGSQERWEGVEGLEVLCGVSVAEVKITENKAKGFGIDAKAVAVGKAATCGGCDPFDDKGDLSITRTRGKGECNEENEQEPR